MKLLLFIVTTTFIGLHLFGQKEEPDKLMAPLGANTVSKPIIQQLTYREFTRIYFPSVTNGFGNYASIDLSDTKVTFAGNIVSKNGDVIGLKANGGVSDGVASVFSSNKWNSEFSFDLSYNLLQPLKNRKGNYLFYNRFEYPADAEYNFNKGAEKIKADGIAKRRLLNPAYSVPKLQLEIALLSRDYETAERSFNSLNHKIDSITNLPNREISLTQTAIKLSDTVLLKLINSRDSLGLKMADKRTLVKQKQDEIALQNSAEYPWFVASDKIESAQEDSLLKSFPITGFRVWWFTFGIGLSTNYFKHLTPSLPVGDQISKMGYGSFNANIQYSLYNKTDLPYRSIFLNISLSGKLGDNFSDLSDVSLVDKTQYGATPDSRFSEDKYTVYSGKYETDVLSSTLKVDLYWFLFAKNQAAIHVYPSCLAREKKHPETYLGTGLYFTFKNEVKDKDPVNIELFYNFNNVFAQNDPELKKQYQRNQVGIRFVFPFKFKF